MVRTLALALALVPLLAGDEAGAVPRKSRRNRGEAVKRAESTELATAYFRVGSDLYDNGEFLDAAKAFERAALKAPERTALLFNVASAYGKGGDRKRAVAWYKKYLAALHGAKETAVARARVEVLEREENGDESARAMPFVEPRTKHTFQTRIDVAGRPYLLLGAGARSVKRSPLYALGLYVEDVPARRAFPKLAASAGGADRDSLMHSDLAAQFVVMGDFGKAALLHFMRDAAADDVRDEFRAALAESLGSAAATEVRRDAERFLALLRGAKAGDELLVLTGADGQVTLKGPGKARRGPTDRRLVLDLWGMWLGAKPVEPELKKSLVERIDALGR